MTNKPMLSVELELIQRIADHCKFWIDHPYLEAIADVEVELRALLDKPAAQHQGEPVAWRYKKSWEKTGWKICDKHPTDYGIDDECYEIQALYAEQPAPVAVVMPGRKPQDLSRYDQPMADWFEEVGYNKALDDVTRLNGVKP